MKNDDYKKLFENLKRFQDKKIYYDEIVNLIRKLLYERTSFVKNSDNNEKRTDFFKLLREKFEELYESYKLRASEKTCINYDIEYIGKGHTSLVFRVGDVALKIGKTDNNYETNRNYDFDFMIPVFYKEKLKIDKKEYYTIYVTPLVDCKNINEEELYESYKKIRDLGYIWNDPTLDNVGRIIKDIKFNNHAYKKSDIVIIDLEDLAYVGEITPDIVLEEIAISGYNQKTYVFEMRYIKEKEETTKKR